MKLLEINNWNEFLEYYDKVQMYVYRKFKTLMNFNERKILPDKLFVYSTRNLYESYSNHMKNVEFCGYDSNVLSQLDLKREVGCLCDQGNIYRLLFPKYIKKIFLKTTCTATYV